MSNKDTSGIQIGSVTYGVSFPCPECGEPLWAFIPTDGGKPEVVRARDIPGEDDAIDDSEEPRS